MKLLVIENDWNIPDEVRRIISKMKPDEVKEFNNFQYCDKTEFFPALMWCDTILVQTTLIHKYQVDEMVELMSKIRETKQIVFTWEGTVKELYAYMQDEDDIVNIAHHKIGYFPHDYEIEDGMRSEIQNSELFAQNAAIVAEKLRIAEEIRQAKLAAEKLYRDEAINRPTGQMALIKTIQAHGKAWSTLVTGSIVPVLDMTGQDERSNRGIWVWGNGEPVKLLNDGGYNEYELQVEPTDRRAIAMEVLKMANVFEPTDNHIFSVMGLIDEALKEDNPSSELHWNLTIWLDENNIPRRGIRTPIEQYLHKVLLAETV